MHLADLVRDAGVEQDALRGRRLAGIDVGLVVVLPASMWAMMPILR